MEYFFVILPKMFTFALLILIGVTTVKVKVVNEETLPVLSGLLIKIILPLSIPMLITVFMFAFSWQWTDNFYSEVFYTIGGPTLMPDIIKVPKSLDTKYAGENMYVAAIRNTCGILILLPLLILYSFMQRYIIQGIERSGITG